MTELDLLLIRQREHERFAAGLRYQASKFEGNGSGDEKHLYTILRLDREHEEHAHRLDKEGFDYMDTLAETMRIRAEVRGEK